MITVHLYVHNRKAALTMTKEEFLQAVLNTFGETDYNVIEFVYTYHPSISNGDGKSKLRPFTTYPVECELSKTCCLPRKEAIH